MRLFMSLVFLLLVSACGTLSSDALPTEGPIENQAIAAGATQAQGGVAEGAALSVQAGNGSIELDGSTDLDSIHLSGSASLTDCRSVLARRPSLAAEQCSYGPHEVPTTVDTVTPNECTNGRTYLTLNRLSGDGAHVGLEGRRWVELDDEEFSQDRIDSICEGNF